MSTAQADTEAETQTLYLRDIPKDLVTEIDAFADETKGTARMASRSEAAIVLLRRGLAEVKRKR